MQSVAEVEFAALDFETTGLHADRDRVVEVAVARGRLGARPSVWTTLVNPGRPVAASAVHGITDDMVAGQPSFAQIAPRLLRELDGAVLVAHNAPFDLSFLDAECARAFRPRPPLPVLDTLGLARRLLALPSNSLGALCTRFEIPRDRAHRADDDALATWHLAGILLRGIDPALTTPLDQAIRLCARRTTEEELRIHAALKSAFQAGHPITIDYHAADAARGTRRAITVSKLTSSRVEAWCHLRGAERVFRLDRIRLVEPVG